MTTHDIEFEYEVEALGQLVTVEARVRLPPLGHSHPGDPENNSEVEIESVTLNGFEVNPDMIKVAKEKAVSQLLGPFLHIPEWFKLTDLLRDAAWERAEMEAA